MLQNSSEQVTCLNRLPEFLAMNSANIPSAEPRRTAQFQGLWSGFGAAARMALCLISVLVPGRFVALGESSRTPNAEALALAGSNHWAFAPLVRPELPAVRRSNWGATPVDRFILARLEHEGVRPSPPADRATALRRLSLDLTGLPPSEIEMTAWLADTQSGAWERQVERLLASPHYGERWGRHWLDLARYADTSGYQVDRERPWAWVYRDWVIRAVNADLPFDTFSRWQIAGDLLAARGTLPSASDATNAVAASGFHRMTMTNHEDGSDAAEDAARVRVERVSSTGIAWLGLTWGCAQCHSHKYDPMSQREFFQLYSFFDGTDPRDADLGGGVVAYTFQERSPWPATRVHVRGDFRRPGDAVQPAFPAALNRMASRKNDLPSSRRPDRTDLAEWLVTDAAPLTARVAVNQFWMHLFGRGLVATTEDFGLRGERPSHPELLEWLASEFVRSGWSRKEIIRLIVNSSTYRQSSVARADCEVQDPLNRRLARQNRIRLEAEILRDSVLDVSGLLNREIGGRSFRPVMPPDVKFLGTAGAWTWTDDAGPVLWRRSLYSFTQRTVAHPLLATFDQAGSSEVCTRRERSNTPLQALTLLNHPTFVAAAETLGAGIHPAPGEAFSREIVALFQKCLGRNPSPAERRRLVKLGLDVERVQPGAGGRVVAQTVLNLDEFQNRE